MSAIDTAISNNQKRALNIMINHVVEFQNSYVSSYLFKETMIHLMEMGIEVFPLFNSNIFIS